MLPLKALPQLAGVMLDTLVPTSEQFARRFDSLASAKSSFKESLEFYGLDD